MSCFGGYHGFTDLDVLGGVDPYEYCLGTGLNGLYSSSLNLQNLGSAGDYEFNLHG